MSGALGIAPTLESEREERKQSWQDKECLEALAALANTRGGTLWVGVKDNGDPVEPDGWLDADDTGKMEAITNKIVAKLGVHPASVTIETLKGKPVLAIQMPSAAVPVLLNGHYWRRVGNSSREVPADELTRFLLSRTGQTWDGISCTVGMDALDIKTIEDFKIAARPRLTGLRPSDDAATILGNLRLQDADRRLLRAAVMLFGRNREPQGLAPSAQVQMGRFKDYTTILDDKVFLGNLFQQIDGVTHQFRQYLQVRYEFHTEIGDLSGIEAARRIEIWDYPLNALREAVANALLHRDYTSQSSVMIRVFEDRVTISNPGSLPEGITVSDLYRDPHPSKRRNPLLAEAFYYAGMVERWGTGTTRMVQLCQMQGLPEPEFTSTPWEFSVTFHKDAYTPAQLHAMGLSERQTRAILYSREHGSITNREFRKQFSLSHEAAHNELDALVRKGLLRPEGRGRSLRYILGKVDE